MLKKLFIFRQNFGRNMKSYESALIKVQRSIMILFQFKVVYIETLSHPQCHYIISYTYTPNITSLYNGKNTSIHKNVFFNI